MQSDWLSLDLQLVQYADAVKRNRKMSLLKSLLQEGLEEMVSPAPKRNDATGPLESLRRHCQRSASQLGQVILNRIV